jgi:hypothetical protein
MMADGKKKTTTENKRNKRKKIKKGAEYVTSHSSMSQGEGWR